MPDDLGLESGRADLIVLHNGETLRTHGPAKCKNETCCIHNPSTHSLMYAPLNWRTFDGWINIKPSHMERICAHGTGHPDPDGLAAMRREDAEFCTIHGCDGCCGTPGTPVQVVDTIEIATRGTGYIITATNPPTMTGDQVNINGVVYEVTGVEMRPTATPTYVIDGKQLVLLREVEQ